MEFQLTTCIANWNEGDRISLPHSVLQQLQSHWHSPTTLATTSDRKERITSPSMVDVDGIQHESSTSFYFHLKKLNSPETNFVCGVKDFSAPDGKVCIPAWILSELQLTQSEEIVSVTLTSLPNAKTITLIAKDISSLSLTNPRAVLENYLRSNFSSLSEGITLPITTFQPHLFQTITCHYYVEGILPTSPASVINVDVEVNVVPFEKDPMVFAQMQQDYDTLVLEKMPTSLPLQDLLEVDLKPTTSKYYTLAIPNNLNFISVRAKVTHGDISMFVHPFLLPNINECVAFCVHPKERGGVYSLEYTWEQKDTPPSSQMILGIHTYGEIGAQFLLSWSDHSSLSSEVIHESFDKTSSYSPKNSEDFEFCGHCETCMLLL
ncbi:Ubiquitin recognition factor in ER-associated degradation protein 1 [Coelomomyces lativittatus]|nr:Ubiquitin recognition factor in ER-associated degradation protein 1 [Coelomomyces lativittatus]KAJ1518341.1 Ubiquitin recognition factor in ER-associated degradation protein 1 [Coelomomyces lativittatus]